MKVLLDTNVLSEVRKPDGDRLVRSRVAAVASDDKFVSAVTIGEISYGIARVPAGRRRRELESWLDQAEQLFAAHILPVDRFIARLWGELTHQSERQGRLLAPPDGMIAATALHHGLRLMTRNVKDFQETGVAIINPWEP